MSTQRSSWLFALFRILLLVLLICTYFLNINFVPDEGETVPQLTKQHETEQQPTTQNPGTAPPQPHHRRGKKRVFTYNEARAVAYLAQYKPYTRDAWPNTTSVTMQMIDFLDLPKDLHVAGVTSSACSIARSYFVPVPGCPSQYMYPAQMSCNAYWHHVLSCHGLVRRTLFQECREYKRTGKLSPIKPDVNLAHWNQRIRSHALGIVIPVLHGGVRASELKRAAMCYLSVAGLDIKQSGYRIGEVSVGVGSTMFFMCPPTRGIECFGVDPVAAGPSIARARFPHLRTYAAWRLADVLPTSVLLDAVFSIGVVMQLDEHEYCAQLADALRVLRPGGKFVVISQSASFVGSWAPRISRTRVSPKAHQNAKPLSFCAHVSQYIERADVVRKFANDCYMMLGMGIGDFISVIVRNDVPMGAECSAGRERAEAVYARESPVTAMMNMSEYNTLSRVGIEQWSKMNSAVFRTLEEYARRHVPLQ
eukprot:PhM_4_TR9543/c0_g1_i2/m.34225